MFSGIKSMLFGYSETTIANVTTNSNEPNFLVIEAGNDIKTNEKSSSIGNDTSTLLEQTLNAATTKFTEQLLPQSPSIEQLQSSSHHLLPTLIEQHEEDERKKLKEKNTLSSSNVNNNLGEEQEVDYDDDDDCFNEDSWELLDLVEKPTVSMPETFTQIKKEEPKKETGKNHREFVNKTGGILKQQQSFKNGKKTSRQEAKVFFKKPDLVKATEEKIELNLPNEKEQVKEIEQEEMVELEVEEEKHEDLEEIKAEEVEKKENEVEEITDFIVDDEIDENSVISIEPITPEMIVCVTNDSIFTKSSIIESMERELLDSLDRNNLDLSYINKKPPTLVKPIEPERQPGWQLRRKRSKRRPLSSTSMNNISSSNNSSSSIKQLESTENSSELSNSSSARSSPSLMDRIGNTIVANLTNLTNGLQGPNINHQRNALEEAEKFNQSLTRKSNLEANLISRKKMSKAYLKRQNECAKSSSSRRPDRRLKMSTTPNGVSINRKVQTNFH